MGPYGTVIEHPLIRGLLYMVIAPIRMASGAFDMYALVVRDEDFRSAARLRPGTIVVLGDYCFRGNSADWIVVE